MSQGSGTRIAVQCREQALSSPVSHNGMERHMPRIEKSIDVDVPLRTAYNQWTQFEEFHQFMEGVKEVKQLGPKDLKWKAEVGGKIVEWTATIVTQDPDREIAWQSTSGHPNSGSVTTVSNSRVTPPTFVTQWLWVSSICVIDSTPSMNCGNDSNCVHWL